MDMTSRCDPTATNRHYPRKTKAQLVEEIERLERRLHAVESVRAHRSVNIDSMARVTPELIHIYKEMPTGLCYFDTNFRFLLINDWLANLNGMTADEHLGRTIGQVLPDVAAGVESQLRQVIQTGEPIIGGTVEAETPAQPGVKKTFQHNYYPVRSDDGTITGVSCVVEDITERKRTEEALRRSEVIFAAAQRMAHLGSWEQDIETGRATWSDEQYRIFGYQPGAIEPSFDLVKAAVHPADRDSFVENFRRADEEGHDSYENEYRIVRSDGSQRFIHSHAEIVRNEAGKPVKIIGAVHDITERKRAEDRLHDAIESIADGFVQFDTDDRVVMWNRRFADLYPELADLLPTRPTAEEMFRERIRVGAVGEFDVPVDDYVLWRMEMRQMQGGTPSVHRHSDGRWLRTTERKTSEGGIVAISTDVTELKNRETDLREAKTQAEFANRSKSEFLANMSHELRTPLNAIIGFSEMMRLETFGPIGNPRYIEYVRDIHESGTHLLSLINDILDLSKIEAGAFELKEEEVDLAQVVAACRRIIEVRAKEAGLTLDTRLSGKLPKLWSDERAVKQIILNLLSNAVKFTPTGGKVTVRAEIEEDGCFVLSVSDTGIGIDADDIPKVFKPFSQIDGSLSRKHDGTGLGLPLVKSLVEVHGGTIELESELGNGTIITIRFPAERVLDEPAKTKDDSVKAGAA